MHSVFRTKMKMLTGLGLLGGQGELPPVPTGREDLQYMVTFDEMEAYFPFIDSWIFTWLSESGTLHHAKFSLHPITSNTSEASNIFHLGTRSNVEWFNYCRWGEGGDAHAQLCNCRTWREYLVRDVEIKNKSPVSWSCFPPGSQLSAICFFADPERQDYICCE